MQGDSVLKPDLALEIPIRNLVGSALGLECRLVAAPRVVIVPRIRLRAGWILVAVARILAVVRNLVAVAKNLAAAAAKNLVVAAKNPVAVAKNLAAVARILAVAAVKNHVVGSKLPVLDSQSQHYWTHHRSHVRGHHPDDTADHHFLPMTSRQKHHRCSADQSPSGHSK